MHTVFFLPESLTPAALSIFYGSWQPYGSFAQLSARDWMRLACTDTLIAAQILRKANVVSPHWAAWDDLLSEFYSVRLVIFHHMGMKRLIATIKGQMPLDPDLKNSDNEKRSIAIALDRFQVPIADLSLLVRDWLAENQALLGESLDQAELSVVH